MTAVKEVHLKGLNGIRAVAALAVVISHILISGPSLGLPENHRGLDLAGFGVSIFFSLSGFLITYLLLIEKKNESTINVKAFYIRRMLRIWPLYYFYLILAVVVIFFLDSSKLPGSLGFYIFLCANIPFIMGTELPYIGHYWSLGVEEQFYLFWPWIVKKSTRLLRGLLLFIMFFLVAKIIFRIIDAQTDIHWPYLAVHVTRFECMAIGALGALFAFSENSRFKRIVFHPMAQVIAWSVIILLLFNKFHLASVIDNDIVAAITVILIMNVSMNQKTIVGLDNAIFNFLGKISYGIYVYHPLIMLLCSTLMMKYIAGMGETGKFIIAFSGVLLLTISVASLSYYFFEKRFLKRKLKYSLVHSTP